MKNTRTLKILLVLILFSIMSLIIACSTSDNGAADTQKDSPAEPNLNEEPIIQVVKAQTGSEPPKKYTRSEEITQDNCIFSDPQKKVVEANIQFTETTKIQISGDIKASVPGIEARIGSAIEKTYGNIRGERTYEELITPPGYSYKYTVKYYEIWQTGEVIVAIGDTNFPPIPYERLISYGLETERVSLDCPQPEPDFTIGNQTTGQIPFSVQFIDQSKGYITDWLWNFGDGVGISDKQSPFYTYNNPSYIYNTARVCFEPNKYSVTLAVSNPQNSATVLKENLITVLPKEYTIQVQPEPYALKDGAGFKILHLPGCSQVCGLDLSGNTIGGACATSMPSSQFDEIGYYFDGQQIGLQVSHQIQYCPGGTPPIQEGIWEFDQWSESFLNRIDTQISQPAGDHNPIFKVDQSLYIRVHYKWIGSCPP